MLVDEELTRTPFLPLPVALPPRLRSMDFTPLLIAFSLFVLLVIFRVDYFRRVELYRIFNKF